MPDPRADMLQGTLDLLILKTLSLGPMHGWGVSHRIQQFSKDVLQVNQGSLYPALHRLEHRGWITSEWGSSDNNRRAKYYRLSAAAGGSSTRSMWSGAASRKRWRPCSTSRASTRARLSRAPRRSGSEEVFHHEMNWAGETLR